MRAPWILLALALAACSNGRAEPEAALAEDAGAAALTVDSDAGETADAAIDAAVDDAGDAGVVDAGPPLPSFADEPFPEKSTSFPKPEEWATAAPVAIDRARPVSLFAAHAGDASPCTARRIREWVRVHCVTMNGGAVLLGGKSGGLSIRFDKAGGTEVIIPVRRGDRRAIEVLDSETLTFKALSAERAKYGFTISEQWPPGDERPTIVAE
jgi:hypothetical protein